MLRSGFDNTAWDRSYYVLYVFVLYYVLYYVLFWPPAGVRRSELFTVTASDLRAREGGKQCAEFPNYEGTAKLKVKAPPERPAVMPPPEPTTEECEQLLLM